MASASLLQGILTKVLGSPLLLPSMAGGVGLVAYRNQDALIHFVTGPGSITRILLLLSVLINYKAMPLGWTYRVITTYWIHLIRGGHVKLGPKALFQPVVTTSRAPPLEIDYNMHKSNSTFFGDADVARAHCICYLVRPGWDACNDNARTRIVLDPKTGAPMKGTCSIVLGAVQCSFKREIAMFQKYELWTSVLSWDRKWIYTVTYFVKAGTVRPKTWLHPASKNLKTRGAKTQEADWEKKVLATSCSKYVFKLGRFTVHPAIMLENSGLLPERPGGWTSGENQMGDDSVDLSNVDLSQDGEWDWRRIEASRRRGYEYATQLDGLDGVKEMFDGGEHGAIASWGPG